MPLTLRSSCLFLLFSLVTGLPLSGSVAAAERPNVLLICVDDLKPVLGCYGDPLARTPNIDRLAKRGTLFERAYCNQAVCSPSRNALLTGMRSQTLGIYDLATHFREAVPDATTLPQHFKRHGYHTEALGKIFHVGHGNRDDADSWSTPSWRSEANNYALAENRPRGKKRGTGQRGAAYEAADVPDNAYPDGAVAEEATRRLQAAAKREQPFFLAVGFIKPHLPFCAPQTYWNAHDPALFRVAELQVPPAGAPAYAPQFGGELRNYRGVPKQGTLPEELQRRLIHGYYAAASYTDAQIGRVIDQLDRLDLADNTLIVLWGDHGWHLGDHGMWCKHTNYEQAAHIPLIVVAPGQGKNAQRTTAPVESVDVFPTLCELAGLPLPSTQSLDGASLSPLLGDPAGRIKPAVFHAYPRNVDGRTIIGRAVRTDRYRLVEWKEPGAAPATAELELYDYQDDPTETRNLATERPEVVAELRSILARLPEAKPPLGVKKTAANRARS